jgi:PilZ domain
MSSYTAYKIAAQEDRCAPRTQIRVNAKLRASGSPGFDVVVYDLSIGGFSCDAVTGMRPGAICWLTLPGLSSLQSEVIWNDGMRVGCAFANLLNEAVLSRLVETHRFVSAI